MNNLVYIPLKIIFHISTNSILLSFPRQLLNPHLLLRTYILSFPLNNYINMNKLYHFCYHYYLLYHLNNHTPSTYFHFHL
mmetsp:Transcript_10076/g.901  ORF Transcript_10076/g.901 Transcript_10076/m.901 type:complete len:80 (+) Transcript_10076:722-961(+)